ncbi:Cation-dependent mannose-6-phosphate receptor, partial [Trachymyrmex septentrionalis]
RRHDRCRNAATREDAFFRRATRESRGERQREKETRRKGRGGAICIGQENCGARSEREREEDEELEDEEDVEEEEEEKEEEERQERQKREPRVRTTDRRSVPIATRRARRARNRHVLHARFSTCMAHVCPCINVHIRQIHFRTAVRPLCILHNNVNKTVLTTGTIKETRMKLLDDKFPIFEILHNDTKIIINIVCYMGNKETSFALDSISNKSYNFKLVSPYGCKLQREMGLSTGSLLVILFFVSVGVYFIGGIIVLKALRGATGWEMVPNHEFWCKLPSLVRDGVVFAFNCCRADSYERI